MRLRELSGTEILPAWFVDRMMNDQWPFGLLTTTGHIFCIWSVRKVHQANDGSIWIDVEMMPREHAELASLDKSKLFFAPVSDRTNCSINAKEIVAAFEIGNS